MDLTIRNLTKQAGVYGTFQVIQKAIAFVVIPVYTHYLTPGEYGTLDILLLIVWFIGIVGGSKLDAAFFRYYGAAKASNTDGNLISSSAMAVIIIGTVFCVMAAIAAEPILQLTFSSKGKPLSGFYLALFATWLQLVGSPPIAYLRARQEARLVGSISLIQALVGTVVGFLCVVILGLGYQGILLGLVASGIILVVVSYWALLNRVTLRFDFSYGIMLFKFALPMLLAPIFSYLMTYADRFFLLRYWDITEVGIYAMAYKFAMLVYMMVMLPFGEMWAANQFALVESEQKQTYQRTALLYVSTLCVAGLCIIYFSYEVTIFTFDESYHRLLTLVAPLTIGIVIWGIVPTLDLGCQIQNKTWIRSFATGVGALSNILLNWVLVPTFGMAGAAVATLLAFIVLIWVTYLFNRSLTDYSVDIRKAILLLLLFAPISCLVYLESHMPYLWFTIVRISALAIYVYLILRINNIQMNYLLSFFVRKTSAQ